MEATAEVRAVIESEIKEGDVFHFQYHPQEGSGWDSRHHCFEGLLVPEIHEGRVTFRDTYWYLDGQDGRWLSFSETQSQGTLIYYCNRNEIEEIKDWDTAYYADSDLFQLSTQNGCSRNCVWNFIRKGATHNKEKMLAVVDEKLRAAHREMNSAARDIERHSATKAKIELGLTDVYL